MYENFNKEDFLLGIEVGVWEAQNAKRMLNELPNLVLIGIDPFEGYQDWWAYINQEHMSEKEKITLDTIQPYIKSGRFNLIKKYSDAALLDLEDDKYDFIYIDADHSYEWASHDIKNYWQKVKSGGILCGHDRSLDGVKRALNEFCANNNLSFIETEFPQYDSWFIKKM